MGLVEVIRIYSVDDLLTTKDHRDSQHRGRAEREASGGKKRDFQNKRDGWMFAIIAGRKRKILLAGRPPDL